MANSDNAVNTWQNESQNEINALPTCMSTRVRITHGFLGIRESFNNRFDKNRMNYLVFGYYSICCLNKSIPDGVGCLIYNYFIGGLLDEFRCFALSSFKTKHSTPLKLGSRIDRIQLTESASAEISDLFYDATFPGHDNIRLKTSLTNLMNILNNMKLQSDINLLSRPVWMRRACAVSSKLYCFYWEAMLKLSKTCLLYDILNERNRTLFEISADGISLSKCKPKIDLMYSLLCQDNRYYQLYRPKASLVIKHIQLEKIDYQNLNNDAKFRKSLVPDDYPNIIGFRKLLRPGFNPMLNVNSTNDVLLFLINEMSSPQFSIIKNQSIRSSVASEEYKNIRKR